MTVYHTTPPDLLILIAVRTNKFSRVMSRSSTLNGKFGRREHAQGLPYVPPDAIDGLLWALKFIEDFSLSRLHKLGFVLHDSNSVVLFISPVPG